MNVLSLFDGMSCGQIALERAGIEVNNYYASEINKYSIKVTQHNYPETIQLGDVRKINSEAIDNIGELDLLIGGSPCQNLSRAVINKDNYNQGLEGENSKLFYEYLRILKLLQNNNPELLFLLENVEGMSDDDKNIITNCLDVDPVMINSGLVSAQDRKRYYWTNIEVGKNPKDKNLVLGDILQPAAEVWKLQDSSRMNFWYGEDYEFQGLDKRVCATLNLGNYESMNRVYNPKFKSPTLTTARGGHRQKKVYQDGRCRKLTPLEYERLQTVPEGYTNVVSNTRRYNMLGDGWTVDVIAHIFKYL